MASVLLFTFISNLHEVRGVKGDIPLMDPQINWVRTVILNDRIHKILNVYEVGGMEGERFQSKKLEATILGS